jgi:hypothetical protein
MSPRTAAQVEAEIMLERQAFFDCDLAGDNDHAAAHYKRMDELLEERGRIPHPRLPSDSDGHTPPKPVR